MKIRMVRFNTPYSRLGSSDHVTFTISRHVKKEIFCDTFHGPNANYITMTIKLQIAPATDQGRA